MKKLQKLMNDIHSWSDKTFPNSTPLSKVKHLQKECGELHDEIENGVVLWAHNEPLRKEFADVFILLMNTASHCGFTIKDLYWAADEKMKINKARKWGVPDKNGIVEHLKG